MQMAKGEIIKEYWSIFSPQLHQPFSKLMSDRCGEFVEKECSQTAGKNVSLNSHCGNERSVHRHLVVQQSYH